MLNPRFHWYAPLPESLDWSGYWFEWLDRRANHAARCCAILIASNLSEYSEKYALRFEILHERAWLLMANTTEVVGVVEC